MTYASPDNEHWYVALRHGRRVGLMLGPFPTHGAAAGWVDVVRRALRSLYPKSQRVAWGDYGVVRIVYDAAPPVGQLNDVLIRDDEPLPFDAS